MRSKAPRERRKAFCSSVLFLFIFSPLAPLPSRFSNHTQMRTRVGSMARLAPSTVRPSRWNSPGNLRPSTATMQTLPTQPRCGGALTICGLQLTCTWRCVVVMQLSTRGQTHTRLNHFPSTSTSSSLSPSFFARFPSQTDLLCAGCLWHGDLQQTRQLRNKLCTNVSQPCDLPLVLWIYACTTCGVRTSTLPRPQAATTTAFSSPIISPAPLSDNPVPSTTRAFP